MQYILKAAPRQKAELAPNISGTLTHWVLENALRRQGEAFKDLTPEELETLVNDLVDEYTAANLPGMTLRMKYLVGRIRRNLVGLLGFIQRDLRQSAFSPSRLSCALMTVPTPTTPTRPALTRWSWTTARVISCASSARWTASMPCRWKSWAAPTCASSITRPAARSLS